MWPNPQLPADLVTLAEEILNRKLPFCAVRVFRLLEDTSFFTSTTSNSPLLLTYTTWMGSIGIIN